MVWSKSWSKNRFVASDGSGVLAWVSEDELEGGGGGNVDSDWRLTADELGMSRRTKEVRAGSALQRSMKASSVTMAVAPMEDVRRIAVVATLEDERGICQMPLACVCRQVIYALILHHPRSSPHTAGGRIGHNVRS